MTEIERRLRKDGVQIKRFASTTEVTQNIDDSRTETYKEATARVIVVVDGSAPNTSMTRCFGGGFKFDYIDVEIIDARNNETLATYSNSGYTEKCPPLSGNIFQDVSELVTSMFE